MSQDGSQQASFPHDIEAHMRGKLIGQTALPPWQAQQSQPSESASQCVPSKQTIMSTSPLVALIHGHEPVGKAAGEAGGAVGGGAAGGKDVQHPLQALASTQPRACAIPADSAQAAPISTAHGNELPSLFSQVFAHAAARGAAGGMCGA